MFDFRSSRGQRSEGFRFLRREGSSLRPLGELQPIVGGTLAQSGTSSLIRTTSLSLGEADSAAIDFASERLDISMVVEDQEFPLGRYLYTDATHQDFFDEDLEEIRQLTSCQLTDQMAIVDTELETAFSCVLEPARSAMGRLLRSLPIDHLFEDSPLLISNSWTAGTSRRRVLESIAELGGYLPPWFDNNGVLRAVQQFDPTAGSPIFDFDAQRNVVADSPVRSNSTLLAPNRIVVVSNGGNTYGGSSSEKHPADPIDPGPLMAFCDVPSTAPHSAMNLGFIRPRVIEIQATTAAQCQAVADLECLTQTVAEEMELATAGDPRHDGWDTVDFEGERWLEIGWSISLVAGGVMQHSLQRSYPPSPQVLSGTAGQVLVGD